MISQLPLNGRILKGCKLPTLSQKKKSLNYPTVTEDITLSNYDLPMKKSQNPGGFMSKLQNCKQEINCIKDKS